ncbi:MAG: transglutaminase-like domain-containing protein [Brotaphodocola sp.]
MKKRVQGERLARDLQALSVDLPEDIARLVANGNLDLAMEVMDRRLQKPIPEIMKERLRIEKEMLARLPQEYPYSCEEAMDELRKNFQNFTEEEFHELLLDGAFEWIYLNGTMYLKNNFIANLIKTRENLADRVLDQSKIAGKWENFRMLDAAIENMKSQDEVKCRFRIRSTIAIHPDKERPGKWVQVQIPLPLEYSQVTDFKLISSSPEGAKTAPGQCAQRTICFEGVYPAGQKFVVEYEFENTMRYWDWKRAMEDGACCAKAWEKADQTLPTEADLFEQLPHIAFTPYLKAMTEEAVGDETSPLKKAKKIYDYITTKVMYSFVRSYFLIPKHVNYIAAGMKGDCGLQALLFITMCRIAGIPARWQSGLYTSPLGIGNHDWAQFYLEEYGWLYADCSFGGAAYRAGDLERWEFYFGNLEPYRLPAACRYQADFCFEKKYLRSDPYDNQNGEVEYEDRGLFEGDDFDSRCEMI